MRNYFVISYYPLHAYLAFGDTGNIDRTAMKQGLEHHDAGARTMLS